MAAALAEYPGIVVGLCAGSSVGSSADSENALAVASAVVRGTDTL